MAMGNIGGDVVYGNDDNGGCGGEGAVAAMVIPDNVASYAASKGLFVIGQSGEDMAIRNDEDFTPAVW